MIWTSKSTISFSGYWIFGSDVFGAGVGRGRICANADPVANIASAVIDAAIRNRLIWHLRWLLANPLEPSSNSLVAHLVSATALVLLGRAFVLVAHLRRRRAFVGRRGGRGRGRGGRGVVGVAAGRGA